MNTTKAQINDGVYSFTANAKIINKETSMEVDIEPFKNDSMHTIYQRIDTSEDSSLEIQSQELEDKYEYDMKVFSGYLGDETDTYNSPFDNQMATPISKIDFVKEKSEKFSQYTGEIENINLENVTPSNHRTNASNFISPYTSQLLQKQPILLSNSKDAEEAEEEGDCSLSNNLSLGPITKSKIKSLMRDETNTNITPEDGIIGANTISYIGQSDLQGDWRLIGRDTTDNDYILRRTSTNFYCNQESSCNMSSMAYEDSFATFINICEQKVKKMVRLDIEKKINLIQMRANIQISKDKRTMIMWREKEERDMTAAVDEKLVLPVFCRSRKTKTKLPMKVFKKDVSKKLRKADRSSKCLSKISMYGFKKPAQIFTSFTKRRGFCAKCVEDGPSPADKFLSLTTNFINEKSDLFLNDKSAKKVKSKLACEKQKKKLVKFLKSNSPASVITVTNESNSYNSSFKSNFNCFLKGNYNNRGKENSADLAHMSHNFKFSQLFDSSDKVKMSYKSVNQKSKDMDLGQRLIDLELKQSSKASPIRKVGNSPNGSTFENDNKKSRNKENEGRNFFNTIVNKKTRSKRLYKVQSSMLVSAKKLATRIKQSCNAPTGRSKKISRYSSSRNLQKNSIGNSSYLKFTRSKRNFLDRESLKKTNKSSLARNCSRNLRRSSFLQNIEKIGVEKGMMNLTNSIRRLEKSLSKSPGKERMKKKNSNGNLKKHKIKALKNLRFSKNQKNENGFISNRDPRNNSCYQIMQCSNQTSEDPIGKENRPNLSFRRKVAAESKMANQVSPKKFNIRNFFDSSSKNGGQVFVGDRYVSVKDIVKNHLTESSVYGKKYQKRNSSNLLEKISKLKSFRKE